MQFLCASEIFASWIPDTLQLTQAPSQEQPINDSAILYEHLNDLHNNGEGEEGTCAMKLSLSTLISMPNASLN